MRPLRVFLDSSDYSVLSDPKRQTREVVQTLDVLRDLKLQGKAAFYYSSTIVSEMAPTNPEVVASSIRRTAFMHELCGGNTLPSFDRLLKREISAALGESPCPAGLYNQHGHWFPADALALVPVAPAEALESVEDALRDTPLNRAMRRKLRSKFAKRGAPKPVFMDILSSQVDSLSSDELTQQLPLTPDDARTIARFVIGKATPAEASAALASSLSDPTFVIAWFVRNPDAVAPIFAWLRRSSADVTKTVCNIMDQAAQLRAIERKTGLPISRDLISPSAWVQLGNETLVKVARRLVDQQTSTSTSLLALKEIEESCPGLTCIVRTFFSTGATAIAERPRKLRESDFVDAVHALYAPYVDLFRADRFMAQHVEAGLGGRRGRVVSRLQDLPKAVLEVAQFQPE